MAAIRDIGNVHMKQKVNLLYCLSQKQLYSRLINLIFLQDTFDLNLPYRDFHWLYSFDNSKEIINSARLIGMKTFSSEPNITYIYLFNINKLYILWDLFFSLCKLIWRGNDYATHVSTFGLFLLLYRKIPSYVMWGFCNHPPKIILWSRHVLFPGYTILAELKEKQLDLII